MRRTAGEMLYRDDYNEVIVFDNELFLNLWLKDVPDSL